jgi:hypothetical protein
MNRSDGKVGGVHVRIAKWLGSSALSLAGTVLLICWLLAYTLEPDGWFAQVGLILAATAYGLDLVREGRRANRESADSGAKA